MLCKLIVKFTANLTPHFVRNICSIFHLALRRNISFNLLFKSLGKYPFLCFLFASFAVYSCSIFVVFFFSIYNKIQ